MQLKLLWELQKLDLTIAAMLETIEEAPAKSGVEEDEEAWRELEEDLAAKKSTYKDDQKTWRELEMKIQKIVDDRQALNDNMYTDKTTAKELEQMQKRMEMLFEEKGKLEDTLLSLMESVEEQEEALEEAEEEVKKAHLVFKEKTSALESELSGHHKELKKYQAEREKLLPALEPQMLERYEMLALKHGGQALALVENDICGGCRVFISSALKGHLYNQKALVYCENCGRLLVRPETLA